MIQPVAAIVLTLALVCAIAAMSVRSLLSAVVIFGAFSFFSASYFGILGALDVAFTEAAIGAVITTVYFVVTLSQTKSKKKQ